MNDRIRVSSVLVVDDKGNQLGEMQTPDALNLATERGLDLVEVAPQRIPLCVGYLTTENSVTRLRGKKDSQGSLIRPKLVISSKKYG